MKQWKICFVLCFIVLLTGCGKYSSDGTGYVIYYTNQEKTALLSDSYSVKEEELSDILMDMWKKMKENPSSQNMISLVPEELECKKMKLTDGQLTVTFNSAYRKMDSISEVLLRAALVDVFTQFADVKTVVFHIGDKVLTDAEGEPIGAMNRGMFINNPVGINSYQYASLSLYFPNIIGTSIVREMRNVHYSSNTTLGKVVIEQLIKGPMNGQLVTALTEDVRVLDLTIEKKKCTINLNEAFLKTPQTGIEPEVIIYSVVNSLCDVLNVDKVQFQIEGSSDVVFGGELKLSGPFHRNSELIEVKSSNNTSESEMKDLELGKPAVGL